MNVRNAVSVKLRFGRPQFVWLNTLVASMRISGRKRPIGNERNSPRFRFHTPGVRNWLRRLLPKPAKFTPAGWEKSDRSYHGSVLEPGVPVGLGSPSTLISTDPQSGQLSGGFEPLIENGVPEYAEKTPFNCQFWTSRPSTLRDRLPKGSSETKPIWNTCDRS